MKFTSVIQSAFSTAEAARLTGLTPRQLDHWDRLGFLRPSLREASGYGSSRRYSFADLVKLRVAARLRASGIGLARIRRCVEAVKRLGEQGEADHRLGLRAALGGGETFAIVEFENLRCRGEIGFRVAVRVFSRVQKSVRDAAEDLQQARARRGDPRAREQTGMVTSRRVATCSRSLFPEHVIRKKETTR